MHLALQSELRLTQKVIRSTCRQCAERCQSPRRNFHSGRQLRVSQGARNDGSPYPTPKTAEDKGGIQSTRNIDLPQAIPHPESSIASAPPSEEIDASIEEHDGTQLLSYYGSGAKRRLRTRAFRDSTDPPTTAPDWLLEKNVDLFRGQDTKAVMRHVQFVRSEEPLELIESSPTEPPAVGDTKSATTTVIGEPREEVKLTEEQEEDEEIRRLALRYYIHVKQWESLVRTTKSMLQVSTGKQYQHEPAVTKVCLQIQYMGKDGDGLLDRVMWGLSSLCSADTIILDALDISEMISKYPQRPEVVNESRMLSYEVYYDAFREPTDPQMVNFGSRDMEDDGEMFDMPSGITPLLLGRPFAVDLGRIFGRDKSRKASATMGPSQFFSDAFESAAGKNRSQQPLFSSTIDKILSSVADKKKLKPNSEQKSNDNKSTETTEDDSGVVRPTIIRIKDLRAIQEYPIGKQFITQLLEQVQKRRSAGEQILVVGTDCIREDLSELGPGATDQVQRVDANARLAILTPILPTTRSRLALREDRKHRIARVNMRHLWETLRYHSNENFLNWKPGFWTLGYGSIVSTADMLTLMQKIWNFDRVWRLAAHIQGSSDAKSFYGPDCLVGGRPPPVITTAVEEMAAEDDVKQKWFDEQKKSANPNPWDPPEPQSENPHLAKIRASATKHEKRLMSGVVEASKISTTFNDVHVPVETIDAVNTLTTLSMVRPDAFKYGVLASDKIPGLLLYGPPGTGKTLLAKAVAKESGATVLEVSGADINDMYVGEGEKNVKALFSLAKKLSPCIVFLDEADAMFSARSNQSRRASHRELLNQFLKEWDGMSNDSGSAFIMVATNRPMDLDDAVLRRLPRRLLVDLPTEHDRLQILKIHLRNEKLASDVDLAEIAKRTPYYSGSDLKNLAVAAALQAVREENETAKAQIREYQDTTVQLLEKEADQRVDDLAKRKEEYEKRKAIASENEVDHDNDNEEEEPQLDETSSLPEHLIARRKWKYQYPERRTLSMKHFEKALDEISASISEDMNSLKEIKKFDEQYGDKIGGSKKRRGGSKWGFRTGKEGDKVGDTVKVRS